MPKTTWKSAERAVAQRLGGRRLGPGVDRADVRAGPNDWLTVEVKTRRLLPGWLVAGIGQARRYATEKQLPMLVLHQTGQPYRAAIVCMTLADFQAWFGQIEELSDGPHVNVIDTAVAKE